MALPDELIAGVRDLVAHLEAQGLGEGEEAASRVVAVKDICDRLSALVKETVTELGEGGLTKFVVDGVPYRLRQATSYRWNIDSLLPRLADVAREYGMAELEVVRTACSISSARVKALREFELDPDEFRTPQPGGWRIEGPRSSREGDAE